MITKMISTLALMTAAVVLRPFAFDNDAPVLQMEGDKPVMREGKFVYKDKAGKEELIAPDDVWVARSRLTAVNNESAQHRRERDAALATVETFKDIDPVAAREAFEKLSKIDQKKLIDAGEVDVVRKEIETAFSGQLQTATQRAADAEQRVNKMIRENAFGRSKFVTDRMIIPVDLVEAKFGASFEVDKDGKLIGKFASGEKIYTRDPQKSGQIADFDEALEILVNGYADRDKILKGANNSGSGNPGGGGASGSLKSIKRDEWQKLPAHQQKEWADGARAGTHAIT